MKGKWFLVKQGKDRGRRYRLDDPQFPKHITDENGNGYSALEGWKHLESLKPLSNEQGVMAQHYLLKSLKVKLFVELADMKHEDMSREERVIRYALNQDADIKAIRNKEKS